MPVDPKDINAALALLAETFPRCFAPEPHLPHRPLKIGIDRDLAELCPALNARERGAALRFYTGRLLYLESLTEGADRIGLDGSPVGKVSVTDAEHARTRIIGILAGRAEAAAAKAARKAKKAAKKAARPVAPVVSSTPEPLPVASPAPANSVVKLKDRPVLTLPAFRKGKEAVS